MKYIESIPNLIYHLSAKTVANCQFCEDDLDGSSDDGTGPIYFDELFSYLSMNSIVVKCHVPCIHHGWSYDIYGRKLKVFHFK